METLLKGKRILIVEDEEINYFLLRDILEIYQAIVTWAEMGQQAVDMIKNGDYFDLILMDINLPTMDGLETTQKIKALHPNIPVIAQTAFAQDSEVENCYQAGCDGVVLKPFTQKELFAAIQKVFSDK
jgi:two-component system, cell cycle response regulator DivK